jgi:hypothetical protein
MHNKELHEKIEALVKSRPDWNIDELNREMRKINDEMNSSPKNDFEGFSPEDMNYILYYPFQEKCPIRVNMDISGVFLLKNSPLYRMAVEIMNRVQTAGSIKLTPKGNFPVNLVKELYGLDIYHNQWDKLFFERQPRQDNWLFLEAVLFACKISGVIKKRNGRLTLTKKGEELLKTDGSSLFIELFSAYTTGFNWAYFDGYDNEICGQLGFLWSLWLVKKYGSTPRKADFYAQKYLTAFPAFRDMDDGYETSASCFITRFLERFCDFFGFINTEEKGRKTAWEIKASPLLNAIFLPNSARRNK